MNTPSKTQNHNIAIYIKLQNKPIEAKRLLTFQTKLKLFTFRSFSKNSNFMKKNNEYLIVGTITRLCKQLMVIIEI